MESTKRLVHTWMASGRDSEVEEIASEIGSGQTSLVDFVKALGEYLTSEEADLRAKGVTLFTLILSRCPPEKLTRQSVHVLVAFYRDKLDDTETIIPALKGLALLASLPTFRANDVVFILRGIFEHVKMRSLTAPNRFIVFSIVDKLMAHQRHALKESGNEFLSGYINLAEGEKDPRNLVLAFAIDRVLLVEFDIKDFVEALFNITFCYFPITFRQPADDPYGITTDMLKESLLSCLNATSAFGPLAIPVFVEKLTAGSPATKLDTLRAISSCLPVYGASLARASAGKLWSAIKLEILHPTDTAVEVQALCTMQGLIATIYTDQVDIQGFAQDICVECIQALQEPEKSQAKSAIKIICALLSTTASVRQYVLSQAVPHLVNLFSNPNEVDTRPHILTLLSDMISATNVESQLEPGGQSYSTPLLLYKDELLNIMIASLKTPSTRCPALGGLQRILAIQDFLAAEELSFVINRVNDILLDDQDQGDASEAALELLSSISMTAPRLLLEQTLPHLFALLPDQAPARDAGVERAQYWHILFILRRICVPPELFDVLVIRLIAKLDHIAISTSLIPENADIEPSAAYAHSILTTFVKILDAKIEMKHSDVQKHIHGLIPRLFRVLIHSAVLSTPHKPIAADHRLVGLAAQIVTLVVQTLPRENQEAFASNLFSAYLKGEIQSITDNQKSPSDTRFLPFDPSASTPQKNLVAMLAAAVVAIRRETQIPFVSFDEFLDMMVTWGLTHADNSLQRESAWHVIASIVNKRSDDVSSFLSKAIQRIWEDNIEDETRELDTRRHCVTLWQWISRALLVKEDKRSMQFIDRLLEAFDNEKVGWHAAKTLGDVCRCDSVLTRSNHAVIKPLYAQKFVNTILPRLVDAVKVTTQSRRGASHLVALISLLGPVSKAIYAHRMSMLMPFFLRALELPDDHDLREKAIDILSAATEDDPQELNFITEHASTLVLAMLKNCRVKDMPSARVRIAALKYLGMIPSKVRYDILHPCRSTTIRELSNVLDDPKRLVRREAVDARNNWLMYRG